MMAAFTIPDRKNDSNPLIRALPPETDYLSYLTILEYNLTAEQLPTLHAILQDTTLTANIGWDLVHLLLPLLPASQQCLQDVARLGNPREVVLKVTELLEEIGNDESGIDEDLDQEEAEHDEDVSSGKRSESQAGQKNEESSAPQKPPSTGMKFVALLEMLAILHPRIKTKHPTRFLTTSLQALLLAYSQSGWRETEAVLSFMKSLSGTKRPNLPPRKSSSRITSVQMAQSQTSAPDPEGQSGDVAPGEDALQKRLLQSFLTYVTEAYLASTSRNGDDVPGMAWSCRFHEKMYPKMVVPRRITYTHLFTEPEVFHERDSILGQILALARDLGFSTEELRATIAKADGEDPKPPEENELPSSPDDVPLSRIGALYIVCAMVAAPSLFDASAFFPTELLPNYSTILANFIGDPNLGSLGTEPEALLDALFFLGSFIINTQQSEGKGVDIGNDEAFNMTMQRLSMLSANIPSPALRYQAHQLASTVLHSHPSDQVRLAYIKDTLEHCPYENLKASAVGWLKDEVLAASKATGGERSIFSTPALLQTLSLDLFPSVRDLFADRSIEEVNAKLDTHQVYFLALLNFLYLLLSSPTLWQNLDGAASLSRYREEFLEPLLMASKENLDSLRSGNSGDGDREEDQARSIAERELLLMNVQQVVDSLPKES